MHHFTKQLEAITAQRNKMFLNKTAAQIAEMQDAADYINRALDYELPFVKEALFPHPPCIQDTVQGQLKNCFWIASLAAVVEKDPGFIQ